jgi:hypothetical protein
MAYYRFTVDDGATEDKVVKAESFKEAWHKVIDELPEEDLEFVSLTFEDEVTMPEGFEGEFPEGGEEEGTRQ